MPARTSVRGLFAHIPRTHRKPAPQSLTEPGRKKSVPES
jgi:hypothetical protein